MLRRLNRGGPIGTAHTACGSYFLAVPLVTAKSRAVRVNLSLDKGIVDAIDAAAELRGLSRSAFIAEAARNEIAGR